MLRRRTILGLWALGLTLALGGCDTTPTLPLPPPSASVSAPNSSGLVTVEGVAKRRALVFLYNEETEEGVFRPADEEGLYVLVIGARSGDTLTLWQRQGSDVGEPVTRLVPER